VATQRSAAIYITNNTDGNAWILLYHSNSSNGTQQANWNAAPGQTVGPLTVFFETGIGSYGILDYWSVLLHVEGGSTPGFYVNSGTNADPHWKECQLESADAGQSMTLSVSASQFDISLRSGGCTDTMTKLAPGAPITHVFVLMLENHSFDNMFAMSGIAGITAATTADSNSFGGNTYNVQPSAPLSLPTDPGHEFNDVVEQLAGQNAAYSSGGSYPAVNNSGFAANYATSATEGPTPPPQDVGDIMACFATKTQLPVIHQLATEFALCDQWYSSLPGPTWPNRFFVHGASSSGLDDSPSGPQIGGWEAPGGGFQYPNGSIYQALAHAGIPYRFYNDSNGSPSWASLYSDDPGKGSPVGAVAQVAALKGITLLDVNSLKTFAADLQGPYPYPYTFIEPHYGDVASGTYAGGSSQHPMDDVYGGEHLLAAVYAAIRNSPYWNTSLLIVTYDEHGGFYDSANPPGGATAPGDNPSYGYSTHGFTFEQYGVRVPAIVVSPRVAAGTVDHTLFDHSSVPKTLERLWGLAPLTNRDATANDVLSLLSLAAPRACPTSLNSPAPLLLAAKAPVSLEERALVDAQPLPLSGNLIGALGILKKTEMELSAGTLSEAAAATARFAALQTRGHARAYAASVMEKVGIAKRQREAATRRVRMRRRLPMPAAPVPAAALATVLPGAPVSPSPSPANVIEVVLTSGERLRIPADPATLRMVLAALREQPPRPQPEF
jgi:phospholipase C